MVPPRHLQHRTPRTPAVAVNFTDTGGGAFWFYKAHGTLIGTVGSFENIGNTIAKAVDGLTDTFFDAPSPDGRWVGLALGSPKIITQVHPWSGMAISLHR